MGRFVVSLAARLCVYLRWFIAYLYLCFCSLVRLCLDVAAAAAAATDKAARIAAASRRANTMVATPVVGNFRAVDHTASTSIDAGLDVAVADSPSPS